MINSTVKNIISKFETGSKHVILIDNETGEVYLSAIWHSDIPEQYLDKNVVNVQEPDIYEMRLFVE